MFINWYNETYTTRRLFDDNYNVIYVIHIYATLVFFQVRMVHVMKISAMHILSFIEILKIHVQCALIIMNIWESLERKLWLVISWRGGTNHYFHYSTLHCRHTHFCFLLYYDIYLDFEFLFDMLHLIHIGFLCVIYIFFLNYIFPLN